MKQSLAQWLQAHPDHHAVDRNGKKAIRIGPGDACYRELFDLSDYGVDGLYSGPFLELWPRQQKSAMTGESVNAFVDKLLSEEGPDRYINNAPLGKALGLQPGELYDQEEDVHTEIRHDEYLGHDIESWYNEMSSSIMPWSAWAKGFGEKIGQSREEAVANVRKLIDAQAGTQI
jgi:hypothetical protein